MIKNDAIYALYPSVVSIINRTHAYDIEGNKVEYDEDAVQAKLTEMQAEEEAKNSAALEKLAKIGLTPEDLQRILG
jgi:hypothetical protein